MFKTDDEKFAALAADQETRRTMISSRGLARTGLFWCAMFVTALDLVNRFITHQQGWTYSYLSLGNWILFLHFHSDVRLLMVIDKIASSTHSPAEEMLNQRFEPSPESEAH
jgi:hypothetical protein